MINQEILDAKKYIGAINEASLSRVLTQIEDADFAIVTSWRISNPRKENDESNRDIRGYLNRYKMGGYNLIGHWQETADGIDWETATPEQKTDTVENTILFVNNGQHTQEDFVNICVGLCIKYNQNSVLVGLKGEGVYLYYKSGSRDKISDDNKPTLMKISQAYSQLRGKENVPFVFEGMLVPYNNISKQTFSHLNMSWL